MSQPHPSEVQHFILTRFNLKIAFFRQRPGSYHAGRLDPVWLQQRFTLFDRYCVPSLRSQTCTHFTWLVFFDCDTPEPFRKRIDGYRDCGILEADFLPRFDMEAIRTSIQRRVRPGTKWVITTRLDNDDMISRQFVSKVQKALVGRKFQFLNFADGYQYAAGRLYFTRHESSPFLSLIEPAGELLTAMGAPHGDVLQRYPVMQICKDRAWIQIVHGGNVCNAIKNPAARLPVWRAMREFPLARPLISDRGLLGALREAAFALSWQFVRASSRRRPGKH